LGLPIDKTRDERVQLAQQVMLGIKSKCDECGCKISGGQTVVNPWFLVGGTAITTVPSTLIVKSINNNFTINDRVVLTKPIGVNLSMRLRDFQSDHNLDISDTLLETIENNAIKSMSLLNMYAAKLFHKYKVKGATDVTGFGL